MYHIPIVQTKPGIKLCKMQTNLVRIIISQTHRIVENYHVSAFVSQLAHCSLHQFVPSKPWVFVFCRQTNDLWIVILSPILEPIPHRPQRHDCIGVSVYHHCITYDWRIISAMYSPQDRKMTNRWWRHERKTCNLFNIYPGWWLCNHPLSTCVDCTQDLHMCVSCLKDDQPLNQQTHQLALSIVQLVSRLCNRQQFVFSSLTASLSTGQQWASRRSR